jgi:hypothetical protein
MVRAAWSPPSATIAGTTIEAATAAEILGVFVGSTTVSWPPDFSSVVIFRAILGPLHRYIWLFQIDFLGHFYLSKLGHVLAVRIPVPTT